MPTPNYPFPIKLVSSFFFNYTIHLERGVITKDSSGGITKTWEIIEDLEVVANIQPMKVEDIRYWDSRNLEVDHNVYIESNPNFKRGDRIIVKEDDRKFTIEGVIDFAGFNRLYKIVAKQILD